MSVSGWDESESELLRRMVTDDEAGILPTIANVQRQDRQREAATVVRARKCLSLL